MKVELRIDNPYTTGYITEFEDGSALLLRKQLEYIPSSNDKFVTLEQGIDLSDLSFDGYANSKNWWIIGDINNVINPFDLKIGNNFIVPDLDKILATAV